MLKMEVAIPSPTMDFDFNDARPMPFLSAPSTPKRFGDYALSAPTSPSRIAEFYRQFEDFEESNGVPFSWESTPGTSKSTKASAAANIGDDFAFDFRSELEDISLSAEELFDGGKIRPMKPPPRSQYGERSPLISSPRSPRSPVAKGKNIIREVFSSRKKKDSEPLVATKTESSRKRTENNRGRERTPGLGSSSSRRASRSLSPHRVSEYPWEEEEERRQQETAKQSLVPPNSSKSSVSSSTSKSSSRKWRLKDFLLFRSASEGRASDKEHKYLSFYRKPEDAKNSSFRSTDSAGSAASSSSRRKGQVSAHELHYTTNKAASEDLKKKTFLPYKQGLLGRLAFNPTAHVLVNGSLAR